MARIRLIEIQNFRCLKHFAWRPSAGVNCLIGPGDAGKSTILDAIDYCLGARRNLSFTDADFFGLAVTDPISISITLGELDESLRSMEIYGQYLRSFDAETGAIEDEPEVAKETVLTVNLSIGGDLEPVWALVSDRAEAAGQQRFLSWSDRARLCPTRIGVFAEHELAWRRGSILTKLTDEKVESSGALAEAARQARLAFGAGTGESLKQTVELVAATAKELGISIGDQPQALLDAHAVSFSGGAIALHNEAGVPLRSMGTGSARLLVAGLQRKAAKQATVILVDEVEHGLEPHRIIRLLQSIGSKETPPPLQAFLTTHSPVVVRELSGDQLYVVRCKGRVHDAHGVGYDNVIQGTVRSHPEAFLAASVLICEGASEVGMTRGLDQHSASVDHVSLNALGVALVDAGGYTKIYKPASVFLALGYRVAVLRDDDKQPDAAEEKAFVDAGGSLFKWRAGRALEHELFNCLADTAVLKLLNYAVELWTEPLIDEHVKSKSNGTVTLAACRQALTPQCRAVLAEAAGSKAAPWFKTVSAMEYVGREIVGPAGRASEPGFCEIVEALFRWLHARPRG